MITWESATSFKIEGFIFELPKGDFYKHLGKKYLDIDTDEWKQVNKKRKMEVINRMLLLDDSDYDSINCEATRLWLIGLHEITHRGLKRPKENKLFAKAT